MLEEAIAALALGPDDTVVDATFGGGGHSRRILEELGTGGRLVAVDRDPKAAERASGLVQDPRFDFVHGAYDEVLWSMAEEGLRADAVLFDLGLSSFQIDESARGFSYVSEGPLDMRMDSRSGYTAAEFLNAADAGELARVLYEYGDVPRGEAGRVAREVVRRRPLRVTTDLYEAVRAAVGWKERGGNPAKRVFQAVRVRVNDELGGLERALEASSVSFPRAGGSWYHVPLGRGSSRQTLHLGAGGALRLSPGASSVRVRGASGISAGRRPEAVQTRVEENPRSASARLRAATRTAEPGWDGA
jgi:16S rRNA (cytosine1402-N4)-methyltransferase